MRVGIALAAICTAIQCIPATGGLAGAPHTASAAVRTADQSSNL